MAEVFVTPVNHPRKRDGKLKIKFMDGSAYWLELTLPDKTGYRIPCSELLDAIEKEKAAALAARRAKK
ncbi:MAG: hypothetical protein DMG32_03750 [Acidobacteria bacterium]|nr:MAG: hypothetical protein DMG32_03750 [Acidobacteriota bacterium]